MSRHEEPGNRGGQGYLATAQGGAGRVLRRIPFDAADKSGELFPTSCQSEAIALVHTTAALRGLMLLTGNPGTDGAPRQDYLLGSLRLSVQRALFSRISATARLAELPREDIPAYLDWHMSRAGLDRDVFAPAATDMLTEACEGNPRLLGLLAQAAWMDAAPPTP